MKRSKQAKLREFSDRERNAIKARDGGCIFCKMQYHMEDIKHPDIGCQIMHYIPRSHNGLGIRQNAAVGCLEHHLMFDNGNSGRRAEMKERFAEYLARIYPGWDEKDLVYDKWKDIW